VVSRTGVREHDLETAQVIDQKPCELAIVVDDQGLDFHGDSLGRGACSSRAVLLSLAEDPSGVFCRRWWLAANLRRLFFVRCRSSGGLSSCSVVVRRPCPRRLYLNASIGFSRAALRAGHQPKKIPVAAEKPNATATEEAVTCTAQPCEPARAAEAPAPSTTPN